MGNNEIETPWAVICPEHGLTFLNHEQYMDQMYQSDSFWKCPICGNYSEWSDDNHETWYEDVAI